jgi:hypothetical protein
LTSQANLAEYAEASNLEISAAPLSQFIRAVQVDGTSFFEGVTYFIDGKAATTSTVSLPAGTYTVTVVADPGNGLNGLDTFSVTIPASPAVCGDLTTLALTGSNPAPWLIGALTLLLAGAVAITVTRVRRRDLAEAPQV